MLALTGGTIYTSPCEEPIREGVVLVEGERIDAVGARSDIPLPPRAEVIDCTGRTITAAFWNSHVHFFERRWASVESIPASELQRQLSDFTRYGFTNVFDLSSLWENTRRLRDRVESGEVPGPYIRSTGEGLIPPGALPSETVLDMMGSMKVPLPEIRDAEHAASAARDLLDKGVDGIKLFASSPRSSPLAQAAIRAAVHEAHQRNKPVFIHPNTGADVLTAIQGGVDIIAHTTPHSGAWENEIFQAMKEPPLALTPTLALWKNFSRHDRISAQDRIIETSADQLRAWVEHGGVVLFGSDIGAVDYDPSEEYRLLAQAGMHARDILASLTTAPADRFGASSELGRIRKGYKGDLVVLDGDPCEGVHSLAHVRCTLRAGRIVYRAAA